MLEKIIEKAIIQNSLEEYFNLGELILNSPIEVYSYKSFTDELKNIVSKNKKFIKKRNYAVFYNLKVLIIGKKKYKLPESDKIVKFLEEKYDKAMSSLLVKEAFDQILIYYVRTQNEKK